MSRKTLIWIGLLVGSTIGSSIPMLWQGASGLFSMSSILLGAIGGIAGIWAGFRAADYF